MRYFACVFLLLAVAVGPVQSADSVVVFNEIQYHPVENEAAAEWIELHNQMAIDIDVSAWSIRGDVQFKFVEGTIIPAGGYLVLAGDPEALQIESGITNLVGPFAGRLNNGGGSLTLLDRNDRVMDEIDYTDGGKWPVGADGAGVTLAKRNQNSTSAPSDNWTSSILPGGTPGRRNFPKDSGPQRRALVAMDNLWRFETSGTDLGTEWKEPSFNDNAWSGRNNANLVSYWPFNGDAIAVRGTSGNLIGGVTTAPDRHGQAAGALAFTGTSQQYVSVAGGGGLDGAASGTISLWVRWTGTSQDADCCSTFGAVLGRQANGLFSDNIVALSASSLSSGRVVWRQSGGPAPVLITGTSPVGTNWHHIAVTFSTTSSSLYVDGVLQGKGVGAALNSNPSTALAIGAWAPDGGGFSTTHIDDVAIWDQPLTPAQIAELAGGTKGPLAFTAPEGAVYFSGDGKLTSNDELRRTLLPTGPVTRYFRTSFNYGDDPQRTELLLDLAVDDGAIFYLNGREVYRHNMPGGPVSHSTLARAEVLDTPLLRGIRLPAANLVRGLNVFAVEVHQAAQPDSGMVFGAALNAIVQPALPEEERRLFGMVTPWKHLATNTDPGPSWKDASFNDSGWSNDPALFHAGNAVIPPQRVLGVTATASSEYTADGRLAMRAVDGSGLIGSAHVNTAGGTMWMSRGTFATPNDFNPNITFDLGAIMPLRWMKIWNYNEDLPGRPELLARGIASGDILAGITNRNYTTLVTNQLFNKAPGAQTDFSQMIDLGGFNGRFVRLERLTNFPGGDFRLVGLSEAQFFADPDLKRTELPIGQTTTYFRKSFVFGGDPARARLALSALVDDGAVFYLNGVEVHRFNMNPGPVSHFSLASNLVHEAVNIGPVPISAASLLRGTNVLAVEVHQTAAGSDIDMAFSAELTAYLSPVSSADVQAPALSFSEISAAGTNQFRVELVNHGRTDIEVGGWVIFRAGASADADFLLSPRIVPAGEFLVMDQTTPGFAALPGDKLFLFTPGKRALADAVEVHERPRARVHPGILLGEGRNEQEWFTPELATLGGTNRIAFRDEIVINEIMYHEPPAYEQPLATPPVPYRASTNQWIELFNRSTNAVSLAGWRLDEAVDFRFASNTVLPPGGFLVVANTPGELLAKFPGIQVVGPFTNSLSRRGDRIVLKDNLDNPADIVPYFDDGRWPEAADAGGSSLELRDPRADNSAGEAWAASDESSRSGWKTYSYRGVAAASQVGPDTQWREFVLGLLDAGEVLLDDISVTETPSSAPIEFLQNGTFDTGTNKWRIIGNHHGEVIDDPDRPGNKVLRLKATGPTEHMSNHAETTYAASRTVVNGREYQISFRAKWLSGSPQVHTRLYFNRLPRTTIIDSPSLHGTPGARNSTFTANIGPSFASFSHAPAVPAALAPVTVSVRCADPDGVKTVTLWSMPEGGAWTNMAMAAASNDVYTATLPGRASGAVVQFYVEATDNLGAMALFPAAGRASRALYKVDDGRAATNGLHNIRLVTLAVDANELFRQVNLMSNERIGCTMIYNESELFYDVGLRLKGSEHSRTTTPRLGFNVAFPSEQLFRGIHTTVAIDRSESTGFGQREMLIHQMLNHAGGVPTKYHDLIHVIAPRNEYTGSAELQLARYSDVFLADQFDNGEDGMVFEYELVYQLNSTLGGSPEGLKIPAPDSVVGTAIRNMGDSKENYRWTFLIKNNEDRDDYARIISFAKTLQLSGAAFNSRITNEVDIDQYLRGFAVNVLTGAGDSYGGDGSQHNVQFYVRPSDGKVLFFPHDMDAFFDATRPIVPNADLTKIITVPAHARTYYGHLRDILTTTYNANYLGRWAAQFGRLLPGQPFAAHLSFITQRANTLSSQINSAFPNIAFAVTNAGTNFTVASSNVLLSGTAPLAVKTIEVNGVSYPINWNSRSGWSLQVPLQTGANELKVQGVDRYGVALTNALHTVTVTNTGPAALLPVVINEWMADNAGPAGQADPVDGLFQDWFELYNPNDVAIDLGNYTLTDDADLPAKFRVQEGISIPAKGFILVWADNQPEQNTNSPAGHLHASFQLNNGGEIIALFSPSGARQHLVAFGAQQQNISQGLLPDGAVTNIQTMGRATPRASNSSTAPIRIVSISSVSGSVTLGWTAVAGRSYRIEFKDNLQTPAWTPLAATFIANTATPSTTLASQPPTQRFYRIVQLD